MYSVLGNYNYLWYFNKNSLTNSCLWRGKDSTSPLALPIKGFRDAEYTHRCKHNSILCQGNIVQTHFSRAYRFRSHFIMFTMRLTVKVQNCLAFFIYASTLVSIYVSLPSIITRFVCQMNASCADFLSNFFRMQ